MNVFLASATRGQTLSKNFNKHPEVPEEGFLTTAFGRETSLTTARFTIERTLGQRKHLFTYAYALIWQIIFLRYPKQPQAHV